MDINLGIPVCLVLACSLALAGNPVSDTEAVHKAARSGAVDAVKTSIQEHPEQVNAQDRGGRTPLHYAAIRGHVAVAKLLLANGAEVNGKGRSGRTPLHEAIRASRTEMVAFLLSKGADVNARISVGGDNALYMAAVDGRADIVKVLLQNDADPAAPSRDGWPPILAALARGHLVAAQAFLDSGVQLDVFTAVGMGKTEKVRKLLKDAPDLVNARAGEQMTPLHFACLTG